MMHVEPIYLVACTDEGEYVLATKAFFSAREDAESYAETISPSRKAIIIKLEGLFAQAFRTLRKLAIQELRRNPPDEEAQAQAEDPSGTNEQEAGLTP